MQPQTRIGGYFDNPAIAGFAASEIGKKDESMNFLHGRKEIVERDIHAASFDANGSTGIRRLARPAILLVLLLLAGCEYRIASEKNVDVCALALDPVTALLQEKPIAEPSPGSCVFHAAESSAVQRRLQINLYTRGMGDDDLGRAARNIQAEAEQSFGAPGSKQFGDLAKLALAFGNVPDDISQVELGERGVLMEISMSGQSLDREQMLELTRELWKRVVAYRPPPS